MGELREPGVSCVFGGLIRVTHKNLINKTLNPCFFRSFVELPLLSLCVFFTSKSKAKYKLLSCFHAARDTQFALIDFDILIILAAG